MDAETLAELAAQPDQEPADLNPTERALWLAKAGHWHEAHELSQSIPDPAGAWIHAWLHREDYARGGFRMLPAVDQEGRLTARLAFLYAAALLPITAALSTFGVTGIAFLVTSINCRKHRTECQLT